MAAVPELLQQQEEDRSKVRPFSLSGSRTGGPADSPKPHISSPGALGRFLHPCLAGKHLPDFELPLCPVPWTLGREPETRDRTARWPSTERARGEFLETRECILA